MPTRPAASHAADQRVLRGVRCLRTHGVLLDSVARGTPADEHEPLAATAAGLLAAALPAVPERGAMDAGLSLLGPHVLALLRRVRDWPGVLQQTAEAAVECALLLTTAQHRAGDYASALALGVKARELGEQRLGKDHPLILSLRQRVGKAVYRLGRFEEAEAIDREALADCERALGPTALVTLNACIALSRPLYQLGRTAEAVSLMRRAVVGRAASLGPFHPLTLLARSHLIEVLPGPESDAEAPAGPELVTDCRRELGPHHQITLAVELDCAYALFYTGHPVDALPRARETLTHHEQLYGVEYPITLAARHLLASVLAAVGEQAEAVAQMEKVVAGRRRVLGPDHRWTLSAQEQLAEYRAEGTSF
ncbi:tetratricopeptide repeat protein [Streptomyces vilmorinianum]|uniref:tetratricopeptide repeat protein n=1 Tax=Streptomyces vilmorinianum TaxID=3051092 RepID=UPI0020C8178D|nr:tetratricopeptide repeat protein [Streptomyces vilmorinianum]